MTTLDRRASQYLRFARALGWLPDRLLILHRAIWLGLLDSSALNEITRFEYARPNSFESEEHNFGGLWPWEADVVHKFFSECHRLLVAGAEGGREAIALAKLGYSVTTFDFCEALTAACRKHVETAGIAAQVLDAPPDSLPSGLGVYDGIYAGRGFYHHIPGRSRRVDFLKTCRKNIVLGGPLFLSDFFTRPSQTGSRGRILFLTNAIRRIRRSPKRVDAGDWLSNCMQHAFVRDEIESELDEAGFQTELYAPSPYNQESRLAYAVGIAR